MRYFPMDPRSQMLSGVARIASPTCLVSKRRTKDGHLIRTHLHQKSLQYLPC